MSRSVSEWPVLAALAHDAVDVTPHDTAVSRLSAHEGEGQCETNRPRAASPGQHPTARLDPNLMFYLIGSLPSVWLRPGRDMTLKAFLQFHPFLLIPAPSPALHGRAHSAPR